MSKRKRSGKPNAKASARKQQAGRIAFREPDGWQVRQGVRGALRDPRFYIRRDMRADGDE